MTGIDGLNYPIRIDDQFSKTLEAFRTEVAGIVDQMALVKASLEESAVTAREYAAGISDAGSEQRKANRALKEGAAASKDQAKALSAQEIALKEIEATQLRNAVELEKAAILEAQGLNLIKLKTRGLSVEQEALLKVENALRKKAVAHSW